MNPVRPTLLAVRSSDGETSCARRQSIVPAEQSPVSSRSCVGVQAKSYARDQACQTASEFLSARNNLALYVRDDEAEPVAGEFRLSECNRYVRLRSQVDIRVCWISDYG